MSEEEIVDTDAEAIGGLIPSGAEPRGLPPPKQSLVYQLRFPAQEHKIGTGDYEDPFTGATFKVISINDQARVLELQRGTVKRDGPLPRALIPGKPYRTTAQRAALRELAEASGGRARDRGTGALSRRSRGARSLAPRYQRSARR
jgi:hypothetical protein